MTQLCSELTMPPGPASGTAGPSRVDVERLAATRTVSAVTGLAGLTALPFASFFAVRGDTGPALAALALVIAAGLALRASHQKRQNCAVLALVSGFSLAGLIVNALLGEVAGFGLALALLSPALAVIGAVGGQMAGARAMVSRLAWIAVCPVVITGILGQTGLLPFPDSHPDMLHLFAGTSFSLIGAAVGFAAVRLSNVFEVLERGQLNAYRHLVDQIQDTVVRYGESGQLIYVSRAAEGLFGCARYELSETSLVERVHVQDRPLYLATVDAAARAGEARTIEIRLRRDIAGGVPPEFVWVEIASTPVSSGPQRVSGRSNEVVLLVRDITARRAREAELRQAWRAAEDASRAKSRFLATMGHELRTPLNAVLGFSDMLTGGVGGDLSPQQLDYARMIQQSGKHMSGLISTLLDMSRLDAGKFELVTDAFAPDTLIEPVFRMVDQTARERGIALVLERPRPLPLLVADERACRQILINLVSNAIKFSRDGSTVTVSVKRQGRHIAFAVTDTGIGMDSETVKRLGEPFFQAQDGLARHYGGTGLGLSIVKGLVELHDGTMDVRSAPGEGTTMTILLPINGPETKLSESATVTPLRPEVQNTLSSWPDARKSAR